LTRAQVAANARQVDPVAIRFNTRKTNRQEQVGAILEKRVDSGNNLRFSVYGGDRQVRQYQSIAVATGASLNTYSGGVVDLQRYFGGGSVNWVHDGSLFGRPFSATVGAEQEMMNDRRRGFDNNNGVIGTLRRDEDNRIDATNVFAQGDWRFTERASASLGLRSTRVGIELKDYFITAANPNDSGKVVFANTSPVAGLTYRVTPELSAYASAGRGFETPTFAELAYRNGGTGMNTALKPGRNTNYEIGIKGRIAADHRVTLARFDTRTRDEIVTDTAINGRSIFKNASQTRRTGWEASWNAVLPAGFDAYAAYTIVDAKYTEAFVSGASPPVTSGNRIPGVPRTSVYAELRWQHLPAGFTTALEARHASAVFVDDQNSDAAAAYTVTNLRFGLEQKARDWQFTQTLRIDNLANTDYIGSVIVADGNNRFFETAPRRGVSLILNARLAF
jgi:iron complex outermembrane receptor protein